MTGQIDLGDVSYPTWFTTFAWSKRNRFDPLDPSIASQFSLLLVNAKTKLK